MLMVYFNYRTSKKVLHERNNEEEKIRKSFYFTLPSIYDRFQESYQPSMRDGHNSDVYGTNEDMYPSHKISHPKVCERYPNPPASRSGKESMSLQQCKASEVTALESPKYHKNTFCGISMSSSSNYMSHTDNLVSVTQAEIHNQNESINDSENDKTRENNEDTKSHDSKDVETECNKQEMLETSKEDNTMSINEMECEKADDNLEQKVPPENKYMRIDRPITSGISEGNVEKINNVQKITFQGKHESFINLPNHTKNMLWHETSLTNL